ncbi:MAG: hypothetical protein IKL32_06420, partial [Alphaproteobacteria bacterium]|nr:hypothetical protein [Alphaproteobacteria bacterium]
YVLMLKANGQSTWNCTQDENELSYIFEITADALDYGACSVCTGEHCFDDDLNCPEGEYCQNDVCSKCARGYTENTSGKCVACNVWQGIIDNIDEEKCLRCDNALYLSKRCIVTDAFMFHPYTKKEDCEKIMDYQNNVIFYPKDSNGTSTTGLCANCTNVGGGIKDTSMNADKTGCICPSGYFWNFADGAFSWCFECSRALDNGGQNTFLTSKTECDKCPERYYNVAKGGNDRNGHCYLCPKGQVKDTSAEGDGRRCVDAPAS